MGIEIIASIIAVTVSFLSSYLINLFKTFRKTREMYTEITISLKKRELEKEKLHVEYEEILKKLIEMESEKMIKIKSADPEKMEIKFTQTTANKG